MSGRIAFLYLNRGDGWERLTDHRRAHAALESLTVEWGTDSIDEQPAPPVLSVSIRDNDGSMAGDSLYMAGAEVWLQKSDEPTWNDFKPAGTWASISNTITWTTLTDLHEPVQPATPDTALETVFRGRITAGGTVTRRADDWTISIKANGMGILADRTADQGNYLGIRQLDGYHWEYDPTARLDVIQSRLKAMGAPVFTPNALAWLKTHMPPSLAPYAGDSFPDLDTIIGRLASSSPLWPLIYEIHARGETTRGLYSITLAGGYGVIRLDTAGRIAATVEGSAVPVLPAALVMVDADTLDMPDPITNITLKGRKITWKKDEDSEENTPLAGTFGFEDTETTFSSLGTVPANLTESRKSISVETDAIITDDTAGEWPHGHLTPSEQDRRRYAAIIRANSTRLHPVGLKVDTRRISDLNHPDLFRASAPNPLVFTHNRYTPLLSRDGAPATAGMWQPIGGTLTYRHQGGRAVWANEFETLHPLPRDPSISPPTWAAMNAVTCQWQQVAQLTWAELSQIDRIG